jgi:uncharacterized protein YndB with AHSA1/START domain
MSRIANSILVHRPIAAVFDTATTARYWARWHPATRTVEGAVDHPLQLGEHVTERAHIVGPARIFVWTCVERDAPHRLVLEAPGTPGDPRIVYTVDQRGDEVLFTRTLTYTVPLPLGGLVDTWYLAGVMKQQSVQAIINLKALLEAEIPEG